MQVAGHHDALFCEDTTRPRRRAQPPQKIAKLEKHVLPRSTFRHMRAIDDSVVWRQQHEHDVYVACLIFELLDDSSAARWLLVEDEDSNPKMLLEHPRLQLVNERRCRGRGR